jgi:hypothetical protein
MSVKAGLDAVANRKVAASAAIEFRSSWPSPVTVPTAVVIPAEGIHHLMTVT